MNDKALKKMFRINSCVSCGFETNGGESLCDACMAYGQEQKEQEDKPCAPTPEEIADDFEFFIKQVIERQIE